MLAGSSAFFLSVDSSNGDLSLVGADTISATSSDGPGMTVHRGTIYAAYVTTTTMTGFSIGRSVYTIDPTNGAHTSVFEHVGSTIDGVGIASHRGQLLGVGPDTSTELGLVRIDLPSGLETVLGNAGGLGGGDAGYGLTSG